MGLHRRAIVERGHAHFPETLKVGTELDVKEVADVRLGKRLKIDCLRALYPETRSHPFLCPRSIALLYGCAVASIASRSEEVMPLVDVEEGGLLVVLGVEELSGAFHLKANQSSFFQLEVLRNDNA